MNVVFFPRNDYSNNVEVCNHRLGKKMTYTEQTDGLYYANPTTPSYSWFVGYAKSKGIKVGLFAGLASGMDDPDGVIRADLDAGHIWLDLYSWAPNIAQKLPQSGEAGQITQEEWNTAYNDYLLPAFIELAGKKPVALSYSYGNTSFSDYISQLGARNSAYNGDTDYGIGLGSPNNYMYSFSRYKSKQSTIRWYDKAKTQGNDFSGLLNQVSLKIDETMQNGGWLNNFTHWHHYISDNNKSWGEAYLDLLASKNVNNDIYFAGYGEAVAYLVYRQLITKVAMYSPTAHHNDQLIIRLNSTNTLNVDTDLLQVPISVKFSTVGTPLEGQTIKSDCNLISLGSNQYIVEIPYSRFPVAVIEKVSI